MIDSDSREPDGVTSTSKQAQWLQGALAASTSEFNVVMFHHPAYSSGPHGGTTSMRWPFKQWGADVVLNGHDHIYERLNLDGLPYFVDGVGGASLTSVTTPTTGKPILLHGSLRHIKAIADTGSLTFEFYSADGGNYADRPLYDFLQCPSATTQRRRRRVDLAYLDTGVNAGTAWRSASYSDTAWKSGPAQLGYGDGDERTIVSYGPDANNKYTTTYFRRTF